MNSKAFTLIEIMIVVFIIGIVAGFGLPSYTKSVSRAKKRTALNNMRMFHASQVVYERRNDKYWPQNTLAQGAAAIESGLLGSLVDLDTDYTYSCKNSDANHDDYSCTAVRGGCTLTLTQALLSSSNPSESAGCD